MKGLSGSFVWAALGSLIGLMFLAGCLMFAVMLIAACKAVPIYALVGFLAVIFGVYGGVVGAEYGRRPEEP